MPNPAKDLSFDPVSAMQLLFTKINKLKKKQLTQKKKLVSITYIRAYAKGDRKDHDKCHFAIEDSFKVE